MKNLMFKTYGIISILSIMISIIFMITSFNVINTFDISLITKILLKVIYIPVFITTVVVLIKGTNTVLTSPTLFIGNIFKYEHNNKTKNQINTNSFIIGLISINMFIIGIIFVSVVNIYISIPYFTLPFIKTVVMLLSINTVLIYIFGIYRIIME